MPARNIIIQDITRFPIQGPSDTLNFEPGVNVIVGPPNTGKTQWLKILDYLMADDSPAEECLCEEIFENYESAVMTLLIAKQNITIERNWKKPGLKTKVTINDKSLSKMEFSQEFLKILGIPIVHYPQGDPYSPRAWPELGWRSLFRHIYRQQRFWSDLADKQFDSEQHACLMQFLGIAKNLFSDEYGALVQYNKKINELKQKKEIFISMLQEISKELIDVKDLGIALTPQSIELASDRMKAEIGHLQEKRQAMLANLLDVVAPIEKPIEKDTIQLLGKNLVEFQGEKEALFANLKKTELRLSEMEEYLHLVENELLRVDRAEHAGRILTAIKITNCPACDREITQTSINTNQCILCHRAIESKAENSSNSKKRLEFERRQLVDEKNEAKELIVELAKDRQETNSRIQRLNETIHQIQTRLRPTRMAAVAIMPPEISIWDMEVGSIEERLQQLNRVETSLQRREQISDEIMKIQQEVIKLESKVAEQNSMINFEKESDILADAMNSYLNLIHRTKPMLWSQKAVAIDLRKRDFKFFVGERSWKSKLGGTATLIFLMSYHYGLLSLTNNNDYNYPGLLILDFPAELDDGSTVRDKENFVLEPFVNLINQDAMNGTQVIAAGSAFENLEGANRIELDHIWK